MYIYIIFTLFNIFTLLYSFLFWFFNSHFLQQQLSHSTNSNNTYTLHYSICLHLPVLFCFYFIFLLYSSICFISLLIKLIFSMFHPCGRSIWIISCIIFIFTLHTCAQSSILYISWYSLITVDIGLLLAIHMLKSSHMFLDSTHPHRRCLVVSIC